MFNIDDVGGLYGSLPPNMQTVDNECMCYAIDRQIKRLASIARELTVWGDLDGVNPRYYDQAALTVRAPYYKSEYDDGKKLGLIKSAVLSRRYAGSVRAVEELIGNAFKYAVFVPWYEYGGEPYHFKVVIKDEPDGSSKALFEEMVRKVKAARSIIDGVELDADGFSMNVYVGLAMNQVRVVAIPNMQYIGENLSNNYYVSAVQVVKKDLKIGGSD
jgi:P2-related tail formation protein